MSWATTLTLYTHLIKKVHDFRDTKMKKTFFCVAITFCLWNTPSFAEDKWVCAYSSQNDVAKVQVLAKYNVNGNNVDEEDSFSKIKFKVLQNDEKALIAAWSSTSSSEGNTYLESRIIQINKKTKDFRYTYISLGGIGEGAPSSKGTCVEN